MPVKQIYDQTPVSCIDTALEVTKAFVGASFDAQERYVRRLDKVRAIEAGEKQ